LEGEEIHATSGSIGMKNAISEPSCV
jgi:hypothetical protein